MGTGLCHGPARGRRWVVAVGAAGLAAAAAVTVGPPWAVAADDAAAPAATRPRVRRGIPGTWMMAEDGSDPRPLVKLKGARWQGSPTWSHDGTRVAFDATAAGQPRGEVFVYAVGGPDKGTLRNLGPGYCPAFSPDDKLVAFYLDIGSRGVGEPGVWVMRPDGSDRRRLSGGDHPKWSPDGKKLLVCDERQAPAVIDEVSAGTGQATRLLTSTYAKIPGAVYSPDGSRVAFVGYRDGQLSAGDLVVMTLPAGPPRVVFRGRIGWVPNWSADGKRLAFVTWESKDGVDHDTTHVVAADGTAPPVKLKGQDGHGTRTSEAEWSPDGRSFVFSDDREFPDDRLAERPDPPAVGL